MSVTQLSSYANKDTIHALRTLLAQALKGEISGLMFCVKQGNSGQAMGLTGIFATDTDRAIVAASRLQHRLNLMADNTEISPIEIHAG